MTVTATDTDGLFTDAVFVFTINALPTAPSVSLSPNPVYTNDDLVATASGSTDGDGQAVSYAYEWRKTACLKASPAALFQLTDEPWRSLDRSSHAK